MYKVLIADDDRLSCKLLGSLLTKWGYEAEIVHDGVAALAKLKQPDAPQMAILDWMMPGLDGIQVIQAVRSSGYETYTYILLLTSKDQKGDLLGGLNAGADDYLKKPFSMEELIVRIENQLKIMSRDASPMQSLPDEVTLKQFRFYPGRFELHTPTSVIKLSNRESQILAVLCSHTNAAVDRRELLQIVWGDDSFFNSRNLDVYIRKLRGYFAGAEGIEIITLKGQGYHFVVS